MLILQARKWIDLLSRNRSGRIATTKKKSANTSSNQFKSCFQGFWHF